ncbi:MAG: hypothetical protein ACF8TS_08935 [Maioricimonas sp. JB049]
MQFEPLRVARVPRTSYSKCGGRTIDIPWADPHGRFTLLCEAFACRVLNAASSIEQVRELQRLCWTWSLPGSCQPAVNVRHGPRCPELRVIRDFQDPLTTQKAPA